MKRTYYIGEGPEAKEVIDAAFAKVQAFRDAGSALSDGMPDGTMILAQNGGQGVIVGFGIRQQLSQEDLAEYGLSPDVNRPDENGEFIPTYKPNSRSNKGKELRKRINAANRLHTTFSDQVIATLKISRWCVDGRMMCMSSAGCKDGKLFISIPGTPDDGQSNGHGGDKFPVIPSWFRAPQGDEAIFFLNGK